jgi:hypothetical protein
MGDSDRGNGAREPPLTRRSLLASAGATTLFGLTGCLSGADTSEQTTARATTARETPTSVTTRTRTTTTARTTDADASTPTAHTATSSATNCANLDAIPFDLSVGFKPTISSVTPVGLSFCVNGLEWLQPGEAEDYPDYLAPADKSSDCFELAPNEESDPVWDHWGLLPCTYESLRVGINGCVECFTYDDGHEDHGTHRGETSNKRVRWDLGSPDDHLDVQPGDQLDITVYVDVAEAAGENEFELASNGLTVRSK